jgi:hypothetical protein
MTRKQRKLIASEINTLSNLWVKNPALHSLYLFVLDTQQTIFNINKLLQ